MESESLEVFVGYDGKEYSTKEECTIQSEAFVKNLLDTAIEHGAILIPGKKIPHYDRLNNEIIHYLKDSLSNKNPNISLPTIIETSVNNRNSRLSNIAHFYNTRLQYVVKVDNLIALKNLMKYIHFSRFRGLDLEKIPDLFHSDRPDAFPKEWFGNYLFVCSCDQNGTGDHNICAIIDGNALDDFYYELIDNVYDIKKYIHDYT